MKKYICCIILICIAFHSFALQERIYVQTDKHLYLAGEQVLMKFVTTNDEQIPLVFSKIGYAELVKDSLALIQIKVELNGGTGSGQMFLPADLPTGYYRLIAYTQFMRNEGAAIFFEKNIAVMNTFQSGYQPAERETETGRTVSAAPKTDSYIISSQTDKSTYTTRERGVLSITGLPGNIHTLSVCIAGKDWISVNQSPVAKSKESETENEALYRVYLANMKKAEDTGEAFVENGVIFFPGMKDDFKQTPSKNQITQDDKKQPELLVKFLPEYEGLIITGKLIDNETGRSPETNQEVGKINILSAIAFPGDEIRFFSGQINEKDNSIRFFTSGNSGTKEVVTLVFNSGEKYRIDVQSPFVNRFEPKQIPVLRLDSAYYGQLLARSVALQVFRYFSEDRSSETGNVSQSYIKKKPSLIYRLDDYTRFATMPEVFTEFITNVRFRRNSGKQELSVAIKKGSSYVYGSVPLVLLDGVPVLEHELIYSYDPLLVEKIQIYDNPYVLGGYVFDGIIELTTYRRIRQNLNLNRASQIISYEGPQLPYRLDVPDYSKEINRQSLIPDGRHTLLWNPDVRSVGQTSIRLPFDTSDLTGEFQATVEGITKEGTIIFATAVFQVE